MCAEVICPRENLWHICLSREADKSDDVCGTILGVALQELRAVLKRVWELDQEQGDALPAKLRHIVFGAESEYSRDKGEEIA